MYKVYLVFCMIFVDKAILENSVVFFIIIMYLIILLLNVCSLVVEFLLFNMTNLCYR